jgi:hypothetical protein
VFVRKKGFVRIRVCAKKVSFESVCLCEFFSNLCLRKKGFARFRVCAKKALFEFMFVRFLKKSVFVQISLKICVCSKKGSVRIRVCAKKVLSESAFVRKRFCPNPCLCENSSVLIRVCAKKVYFESVFVRKRFLYCFFCSNMTETRFLERRKRFNNKISNLISS